jgi:hypothetical protein
MMTMLVTIVVVAAVVNGTLRLLEKNRVNGAAVSWSGTMHSALPVENARDAVGRYLRDLGWQFVSGDYLCDAFRRGDRNMTRLPGRDDEHWMQLPLILSVSFRVIDGRTCLGLRFTSLRTVKFSDGDLRFFAELASVECKAVAGFLDQYEHRDGRESAGQRRGNGRRHRWYPEDEDAQPAQETPPSADPIDADLALLGLKRGASWDEVHAAYRDACRKYHPDQLNAAGVEPHLVELAVQRFKEVTAVYRRLRDRMGQRA